MKRITKKQYFVLLGLVICAIILQSADSLVLQYPIIAVCKYLTLAYAIALLTFTLFKVANMPQPRGILKHMCNVLAILFIVFYTCLTVDTFLFHTMNFYPGILRYVLYSSYGLLYAIFIVPGALYYLGNEELS